MEYWLRFHRNHSDWESPAVAAFVRERSLRQLRRLASDGASGDAFRTMAQAAYPAFFEDSPQAASVAALYAKVAVRDFKAMLSRGEFAAALSGLVNWEAMGIVDRSANEAAVRSETGGELLRVLAASREPKALAARISALEGKLRPFADPEYSVLWPFARLEAGMRMGEARELASWRDVSGDKRLAVAFATGLVAWARGDRDLAEKAFRQLNGSLRARVLPQLVEIYRQKRSWNEAFAAQLERFYDASESERKPLIGDLADLAFEGKLWTQAPAIVSAAEKLGLSEPALARLEFLAGRAYYEQKLCARAIPSYQHGLSLAPEASGSAEARFRLADCLAKEQRFQRGPKNFRRPSRAGRRLLESPGPK